MKQSTMLKAASVALPLSTMGPRAGAATLGLDIASAGAAFNGLSSTLGWGFDLVSSARISGLSFWDERADCLDGTHAVGRSSLGNMLASTVVTNASTAVASVYGLGQWMSESGGTITLGPVSSQVGAVADGTDPYQTFVSRITLDPPPSNFQSNPFAFGDSRLLMTLHEGVSDHLGLSGANMQIAPSLVPVVFWLLGTGLGVLAFTRLCRKA